ncbi:MAG: hypothetical protein M3Y87_37560 [Myxococcota bacterium]|nr:hypothetical protein [Myxococcota bacterium]
MKKVLVAVVIALCAGCQVSFMGGDMVNVFGGSDVGTAGGPARSCGEPDDARLARTSEGGCGERCRIDVAAGTTDCETVTMGAPREGVAQLDLRSADGVAITIEVCDPQEVAMHIADSSTADADGGDAGTSSHDASLLLEGTTLTVRASEGSDLEPSTVQGYVAAQGCTERTIVISEQIVYLVEQDAGLCGPGMLRINPPTDAEGAPDSLWYLALAGTIDGARSGSGVRSASLCFW